MHLVEVLGAAYRVPTFNRPFRHPVLSLQLGGALLAHRLSSLTDVTLGLLRFRQRFGALELAAGRVRSVGVLVQTLGPFQLAVRRRGQSFGRVFVQTLRSLQSRGGVLRSLVQRFRSLQAGPRLEVRQALKFFQFVGVTGRVAGLVMMAAFAVLQFRIDVVLFRARVVRRFTLLMKTRRRAWQFVTLRVADARTRVPAVRFLILLVLLVRDRRRRLFRRRLVCGVARRGLRLRSLFVGARAPVVIRRGESRRIRRVGDRRVGVLLRSVLRQSIENKRKSDDIY